MDSAEPLSSILWTLTPLPGESAAAGHVGCRGLVAHLGSCIPVQVATPQFGIWCSWLCSGRDRSRFRRFRWVLVVRFSLLVGRSLEFNYVGFLPKSFVGFALTAVGSIVLVENVMENQIISSLNRTNAFFQTILPSPIGEMDLYQTKLPLFRGQR